jgi:hypothetical protein
MVKPKKVLDTKLWDKFANDLEVQLAILKQGTKIAFFVGESDKNYLFINRVEGAVNHEFKVNGSLNMMDLDLFFTVAEDDALEILEDSSKLEEFVSDGRLGIVCMVDDVAMEEKSIDKFLQNLGFKPMIGF